MGYGTCRMLRMKHSVCVLCERFAMPQTAQKDNGKNFHACSEPTRISTYDKNHAGAKWQVKFYIEKVNTTLGLRPNQPS